MPVVFSRGCEYAIRALFEMAYHPRQEFWTIQELSMRTNAPAPFLAKTFQSLVKGKVLKSLKGRHGGFAFARPPQEISLMQIVDLIDGPTLTQHCALGFADCRDNRPCPFHENWNVIRQGIVQALHNESLGRSENQRSTTSKKKKNA
jgi:Rrf2 family protein